MADYGVSDFFRDAVSTAKQDLAARRAIEKEAIINNPPPGSFSSEVPRTEVLQGPDSRAAINPMWWALGAVLLFGFAFAVSRR